MSVRHFAKQSLHLQLLLLPFNCIRENTFSNMMKIYLCNYNTNKIQILIMNNKNVFKHYIWCPFLCQKLNQNFRWISYDFITWLHQQIILSGILKILTWKYENTIYGATIYNSTRSIPPSTQCHHSNIHHCFVRFPFSFDIVFVFFLFFVNGSNFG